MIKFIKQLFCKKKTSEAEIKYRCACLIARVLKEEYDRTGVEAQSFTVTDIKKTATGEKYGTIKIEWSLTNDK